LLRTSSNYHPLYSPVALDAAPRPLSTKDDKYLPFLRMERPALSFLEPLRRMSRIEGEAHKTQHWHGGVDGLAEYHFTIVRGGLWSRDEGVGAGGEAGTFAPWARERRAMSTEENDARMRRLFERCPRRKRQ
jgi:hypothetical protein